MGGLLRFARTAFTKGCLPCVGLYRATVLRFPRHFWSRLKRSLSKGLCSPTCGTGPRWCCCCINTRLCPMLRPQNGCSCICVRCHDGVAGGPQATFPWRTSRDGAARRPFPPLDHALVKAVACELLAETQQPLSRQSLADITVRAGTALRKPISRSTVWRILETDVLKPWRYKYWIFPRDPHFAEKAGPILDLYAGRWQGQCLGPKDHVLSADEKTSIQRKVLTPNDFANLEAIRLRLALYEELSNQSPTPFQWKFDRAKLTALLTKIETRRQSLADAQLKCRDEAA